MKKTFIMMCLAAAAMSARAGDDATRLVVHTADGKEVAYSLADINKISFSEDGFGVDCPAILKLDKYSFANVKSLKFDGLTNGIGADVSAEASVQLYFRSGQLGADGWPAGKTARATVYDTGGRTVLSVENWDGTPLNTSSLAGGVYVFSVESETIKFVK